MADADVYFIFHKADLVGSRLLRDRMNKICQERMWRLSPRGVETFKAPSGRSVALVPADFAAGLYSKVHRTRVAVLVLGSDPKVPLHPRHKDALQYARYLQLKRYVEYKCFYCKVSSDPANDSWAGTFENWCKATHCEGEQDPRCLPFPVFQGDGKELKIPDTRKQFNDRYGSAKRIDDTKSTWELLPKIYHGTESLQVAGHELPMGFHWDVETHGQQTFNTPKFSWRVTGHINVYPDAFLRRGSGRVVDLAQ